MFWRIVCIKLHCDRQNSLFGMLLQVVTATYLLQPNQSSSTDAAAAIAEAIGSAAPLNHTTLQVSVLLLP